MRRVLVGIIYPDEWNQYIPFNSYLSNVKSDYDEIICVISERPMCLLSEADTIYTIANEKMGKKSYPFILDNCESAKVSFIDDCIDKIKEDYKGDDIKITVWKNNPEQSIDFENFVLSEQWGAGTIYKKSFELAGEWLEKENLIYPSHETYLEIEKKYGYLFNNNTFVLLTRNFSIKSQVENTKNMFPYISETVDYLVNNGIRIINIGFPCLPLDIENDNYVQLNPEFTQDEMISFFYMSKGVICGASSGGFMSNIASNCNFFVMNSQWFPNGDNIYDLISKKNKKIRTTDLSPYLNSLHFPNNNNEYSEVLRILLEHNKDNDLKFSEPKKIIYIQ